MSHKKLFLTFAFTPVLCQTGFSQSSEPAGVAGKVTRDIWYNMSARNDLDYSWSQDAFYQASSLQSDLTSLEAPQNVAEQYSQRLRGYIVAPVTGEYRFWASGDDHFALFLSDGESKFNKEELIHYKGYTSFRDFGTSRDQASAPVILQAGQRYYVEAQNKEGGGGDHLSVSWSYAGGAGLTNWALDQSAAASQSSTGWGGAASRAIDGSISGENGAITHTLNEAGSWWQVNLGQDRLIDRVELFNRNSHAHRLSNFRVSVLDASGAVVVSQDFHTNGTHVKASEFWETGGVIGSTVKVELIGPSVSGVQFLCLGEVQVLGRANSADAYQAREIVPGAVLESYAGSLNDQDNDELPDDWEVQHGFDPTQYQGVVFAPFADSDKDGITNLEEAGYSFNPFESDSLDGHLTMERWTGIQKYNVPELLASDAFYGQPEKRKTVSTAHFTEIGAYSGARLRGYVTAPTSGNYRFWLSSSDGSELWISSDDSKYKKRKIAAMGPALGTGHGIVSWSSNLWDNYAGQMSEEIYLEAGQKYFLEMLTQQGHAGGFHVSAAWAPPGQARVVLPLSAISSYGVESEDSDDDYLPDAWEAQYGLSITDNGAVDRLHEGENGDFDSDGLTNRLEYLAGTDPTSADSDGNGVFDGSQYDNSGSGDSVQDYPVGTFVNNLNIHSFSNIAGEWNPSSSGIVSDSLVSAAQWSFDAPHSGHWLLRIDTKLLQTSLSTEKVPVRVLIDGVLRGDFQLDFGSTSSKLVNVLSQDLAAGPHTVTIEINNILSHRSIAIQSIELLDPSGDDLDGNNIPDWLENTLEKRNFVNVYSPSSLTSPAFLEGQSDLVDQTILNAVAVQSSVGVNHYYTNLTLSETGATSFDIDFANGMIESGAITWDVTNLHAMDSIVIRKNDSLKLNATPLNGSTGNAVALTINKDTAYTEFADFQGADYGLWTAEGDAFGVAPALASATGHNWNVIGNKSANSYISAGNSDLGLGKLTSPEFTITQNYIHFRISGGKHPKLERVKLLDATTNEILRTATGLNTTVSRNDLWDVIALKGRSVKIEIEDSYYGSYGWINCDHITFSDIAESPVSLDPNNSAFNEVSYPLASDADYQVHQFTEAGTFIVASDDGNQVANLRVIVKEADTDVQIKDFILGGVERLAFDRYDISYGVSFDGGSHLEYIARNLDYDNLNVAFATRAAGESKVAVRLYTDGPIISTKSINVFDVAGSFRNDSASATLSSDWPGYYVVTSPVTAIGLPAGGSVKISIFRAGVTFLDGSKTKILTAADFVNGRYDAQYLFPENMQGGFCHTYSYFDRNGNQL